jgi:hypothetical protein
MSDGVARKGSRKSSERADLAAAIDLNGSVADMPCSFCFKRKISCRMAEESSRCSECIRRGRSCDGTLVASSLKRLVAQQQKLEAEEEEAGDEFMSLQAQLSELQSQLAQAASRLARLRKIRRKAKERSSELLRRGVQGLDEEDGFEKIVDAHEHWVVKDLESLGVPEDVDWVALGLGEEFADLGSLHGNAVGNPVAGS